MVSALLLSGCIYRYADVQSFDRNDALVTANGTVVVKGFGSANSGNVACFVPGSPYSVDTSSKRAIEASLPNDAGGVKLSDELKLKTELAMKQTERLQALREVMAQLCFAYGNGLFGKIGSAGALEKYDDLLGGIIDMFNNMARDDAEAPPAVQAAPGAAASNNDGAAVLK